MFTMSLAGAAVLGVSYAVKLTGGFASIAELIFVACLTKRSTDMLIALSLDTEGVNGSYERLGHIAYGNVGRFSILATRYVYTLTLLVVHIKVLKDNFPSAMQGIVGPDSQWLYLFEAKDIVTFITSLIVIFPMCLLRTMGLVEVTSSLKFMTVFIITSFIAYFYFCSPGTGVPVRGTSFYEDWVVVKSGVLPWYVPPFRFRAQPNRTFERSKRKERIQRDQGISAQVHAQGHSGGDDCGIRLKTRPLVRFRIRT